MKLKHINISNTEINEGGINFDGLIIHSRHHTKKGTSFELNNIITEDTNGIVLKGDWEIRPLDLLEVLKKVHWFKLPFLIYTETSFNDLKFRIGLASYNETYNLNLTKKDISDVDIPMIDFIGAMMLDYYLSHTKYYISSREKGKYVFNVIELPDEEELDNE